jgi:uncharacterized protein (DUF2235 family)
VLCCDGTNNQFAIENNNVVRLVQSLDRDPAKLRLYYDPGKEEGRSAVTRFDRTVVPRRSLRRRGRLLKGRRWVVGTTIH